MTADQVVNVEYGNTNSLFKIQSSGNKFAVTNTLAGLIKYFWFFHVSL